MSRIFTSAFATDILNLMSRIFTSAFATDILKRRYWTKYPETMLAAEAYYDAIISAGAGPLQDSFVTHKSQLVTEHEKAIAQSQDVTNAWNELVGQPHGAGLTSKIKSMAMREIHNDWIKRKGSDTTPPS